MSHITFWFIHLSQRAYIYIYKNLLFLKMSMKYTSHPLIVFMLNNNFKMKLYLKILCWLTSRVHNMKVKSLSLYFVSGNNLLIQRFKFFKIRYICIVVIIFKDDLFLSNFHKFIFQASKIVNSDELNIINCKFRWTQYHWLVLCILPKRKNYLY